MISHAKISRHRRMFKTLTGLSTEGFKQILPSFEEAWEADLDRRDAGRLRLRGRGGGRKGGPGVRRQTRVHPSTGVRELLTLFDFQLILKECPTFSP